MTLLAPDPAQAAAEPAPPILTPEREEHRRAADALIERAFGPGRYAKTAERLREGARPAPGLSFVARAEGWAGGEVVGTVRLWPILIGPTPAVFLGPIAVELDLRRHGVGAALVEAACARAKAAREGVVLLVGDPPFFGPLGFARAEGVTLPGPVDPARVLWRALRPGALDGVAGRVRAVLPSRDRRA